jgi:hypothetical protein
VTKFRPGLQMVTLASVMRIASGILYRNGVLDKIKH